ncbi:uncharacterized protein LOC125009915 [Mugil cephalus]|uniref:uncharacterized protein LOC125009915 n=1 Tax=Mugil cephalus TaxID=48193 RepID=UPI001FB6BFCE|nr:uncharacterized protein LOC125009915 [Mugil cephalus]
MVHSGSASPMKTTQSASPHLTVPATAPLLVPPPGGSTEQDLAQTSITRDLASESDLTRPTTPTPADAEHPGVTPTKALNVHSNPASVQSCTQTPTPAQGLANGRTSGRKRTPKACDCCGPNSTGHNVRGSGRGRARGRGRGRGSGRALGDTPKRSADQLTCIKSFDLTIEEVEEAATDAQSQTSLGMPVTASSPRGPITNCFVPEKEVVQKKEGMLTEAPGAASATEKGDAGGRDVEMRLSGMADRGALAVRGRGRGTTGSTVPSKMGVNAQIKRGGRGSIVLGSKTDTLAQPVLVPEGQVEIQTAQMHHRDQTVAGSHKFGNGDTVDLFDTDRDLDEEDSMIVTEPGNGSRSISLLPSPSSGSGTLYDLDSEMKVDQSHDSPDHVSVPITLYNGNVTTPVDHDHMEVDGSHPAKVSSPNHDPITVKSEQFDWALRDHRLYCQPGTWEKNDVEEMSGQSEETDKDGKEQNNERHEQLTDMIHDFLESFYIKYGSFIPLSETDVLDHLKKKGIADTCDSGLDVKGEMARYRAGLASAPVAGFMVMYNKHTLSLDDLGTLEEQNWLNDQIINMYGELIMEATEQKVHFFNSFFHKQLVAKGYDGVKRWTKKVDLFSKWLLLIPIHLEIHWSLVTVTMATKTISYYDSQGIVFRHTTDNIMKYLQSEAREKKQIAFQKGWKITIIKGIPQQRNDSDCGVFVLEYCRRLSVKQPLLFSQEDMPHIRKRIYKELCDYRLND